MLLRAIYPCLICYAIYIFSYPSYALAGLYARSELDYLIKVVFMFKIAFLIGVVGYVAINIAASIKARKAKKAQDTAAAACPPPRTSRRNGDLPGRLHTGYIFSAPGAPRSRKISPLFSIFSCIPTRKVLQWP